MCLVHKIFVLYSSLACSFATFRYTFLTIFSPVGSMREGKEISFPQLKKPDDVDVTIELRDWLFALEDAQETAERWWFSSHVDEGREERSWHASFHGLRVNAKSSPTDVPGGKGQLRRIKQHPVELITVRKMLLSVFKTNYSL